MSSRQWYIQYNDSVLGPFSSNQLRQMAERSQITPNVKVRVGENGKWRQASSVKGLFSNSTLAKNSSSSSSELSSEDIPVSTDGAANASSDLSSELSSESIEAPVFQPNSTPEASFGEMPTAAPPLPGEVPVNGDIPAPGEITPPIHPNTMSFGEMPSPPPPVQGERLGWDQISNSQW